MNQIIGTGMYHWWQYYNDKKDVVTDHLDEVFDTITEAGLNAWEDSLPTEEYAEQLSALLPKYGLKFPTVYANSTLHTDDWEKEAAHVVNQAKWAKTLGAKILITNPNPIDWSNPIDKSDSQLRTQAKALKTLTKELYRIGITLAYHTHSPEMRQAAREFHHMMLATCEDDMMFCLDFHWVYRGAGDSHLALEDVIDLYGDRVVTTHIRQSHAGIWSETLEDGDLDYALLAAKLKSLGYKGPLVIENCREQGTKIASSMLEAYAASRAAVEKWFS
jgi:inosose dehydratase